MDSENETDKTKYYHKLIVNEEKHMEAVALKKGTEEGLNNHVKNFLDCAKKR